jgi:ABC-type branched-subunit amino acid transport system ATPase component
MTTTPCAPKRSKQWGGFKANTDVTLTFEPGARHALIGPNGAGKTTFINLLTGGFRRPAARSTWAARTSRSCRSTSASSSA